MDAQSYSLGRVMEEMKQVEESRKRIHNFNQFLKGPMRVYCRVKPLDGFYEEEHKSACATPAKQMILRQSTDTAVQSCVKIP